MNQRASRLVRAVTLVMVLLACVDGRVAFARSEGIDQLSLDGAWTVKDFELGMGMWKPSFRILLVDPPPDPAQLTRDAIPATVPGTVQRALMTAGRLPDPYVEEQGKQASWVEEKEWWFVRTFEAPLAWRGRRVTLECGMVNYRADVWINQTWIGVTRGNYLPLKMDAGSALRYGQTNHVFIRMRAPENSTKKIPDLWFQKGRTDPTLMRRPWVTPTNPQNSEFLMSKCLFGWDWGPHLVPVGILQPIRLVARGPLGIDAPFLITQRISAERDADMRLQIDVLNHSDAPSSGRVQVTLRPRGGRAVAWQKVFPVRLDAHGVVTLRDAFRLTRPALWWPRPLGDQPLYEMETSVWDAHGAPSDRDVQIVGVRRLEMAPNDDAHWLDGVALPTTEADDGIYDWTFVVNGVKVFAQGMNWIPVDALLDLHPERYRYLLRLARDAGVNMLRVWGEGLYETDAFYELCDSMGILVWQDFWLGSYSPAQPQEDSWRAAVANVQRTRNHPSLALYCGGNEFDASRPDRNAQMQELMRIVAENDGTRPFHKASPHGGDEHGGMGILPREDRRRTYWRFISEGGYTQSWPPRSDLLKFMSEDHLFPIEGNEDRLAYRNSRIIRNPHANDDVYGVPRNLDELIQIEMLHNVIGWQAELENTKLERYKVSGCLFWAHNDVWPTTSWSMVDGYGTAKNHYYAFKKAARPVQVTASQQQRVLKPGETYDPEVCVINDRLSPLTDARIEAVVLLGETGEPVYRRTFTGSTAANASACVGRLDWTVPGTGPNALLRLELYAAPEVNSGAAIKRGAPAPRPPGHDVHKAVNSGAPMQREADGQAIARNEYTLMIGDAERRSVSGGFFGEYRRWTKNVLVPKVSRFPEHLGPTEEKSFTITFTNDTPHMVMGLETLITDLPDGMRFYLDDNYVHLRPGETRTLRASIENTERTRVSGPIALTLQTDGWNVQRRTQPLVLRRAVSDQTTAFLEGCAAGVRLRARKRDPSVGLRRVSSLRN